MVVVVVDVPAESMMMVVGRKVVVVMIVIVVIVTISVVSVFRGFAVGRRRGWRRGSGGGGGGVEEVVGRAVGVQISAKDFLLVVVFAKNFVVPYEELVPHAEPGIFRTRFRRGSSRGIKDHRISEH